MNKHDLRIELSNQNLIKLPFLFKSKNDLNGKLVQTIICKIFTDNEAFENHLEAIDEHYDGGSKIVQATVIFIETDRKIINKVKRSNYGKGNNIIDKRVARFQSRKCYIPPIRVYWFFNCIYFFVFGR